MIFGNLFAAAIGPPMIRSIGSGRTGNVLYAGVVHSGEEM